MKKLTTAICISSALMMSSGANAQGQWEWNWLVGASAGYGDRSGDFAFGLTERAMAAVPFSVNEFTRTHNDSGFIWGLFAGLQAHCNGWVFGGELAVDWQDFEDKRPFFFSTVSGEGYSAVSRFERGTTVGASLRAGYEILPYFMPYARIGVETSEDEINFGITSVTTPPAAVISSQLHNDRRVYRLLLGAGAEIPVPQVHGLSFRLEYNYATKGNDSVISNGTGSDGGTLISAHMNPRQHSGKASLVYNFL